MKYFLTTLTIIFLSVNAFSQTNSNIKKDNSISIIECCFDGIFTILNNFDK